METFSKPQSKAKLPTKAVIIAARMGTLMKQEKNFSTPGSLLDRYVCAVA